MISYDVDLEGRYFEETGQDEKAGVMYAALMLALVRFFPAETFSGQPSSNSSIFQASDTPFVILLLERITLYIRNKSSRNFLYSIVKNFFSAYTKFPCLGMEFHPSETYCHLIYHVMIGSIEDMQRCFDLSGNYLPMAFSYGHKGVSREATDYNRVQLNQLMEPWSQKDDPLQLLKMIPHREEGEERPEEEKARIARVQKWSDSVHWSHSKTFSGLTLSPLVLDRIVQQTPRQNSLFLFGSLCTDRLYPLPPPFSPLCSLFPSRSHWWI